jgi:hypothetical protein
MGQYLGAEFQSLADVVQVALGTTRACALLRAGAIRCWGADERNLEQSDALLCRRAPPERLQALNDFPSVRRIAMTRDGRVCALTDAGEVFCERTLQPLTDPVARALAQPEVGAMAPVPSAGVRQLRVPRARDIVAGDLHFCALGIDGSVTCWDENRYGQAGAPTEGCVEYVYGGCKVGPTRVQLDTPATALAAGAERSCAALEDGSVACWGHNENGALGFASNEVCHPNAFGFCNAVPQRVPGLRGVRALVASRVSEQNFAMTHAGEVLVWPEQNLGKPDPRPRIGACRSTAGALASREVPEVAENRLGQRLRVRGILSATHWGGRISGRLDDVLLIGGWAGPPGSEAIVDGQLTRVYVGKLRPGPLAMYVYDACLVEAVASRR